MNAPTSLVPLVEANPALVLLEPAKFDQFFDEIARECRAHVPDVTTDKGRKAIASLAYKVSTTKTAIDEARELLTKEKRDEIKAVDAAGKAIRDRLDALRDEVKAPLEAWKVADKERQAKCEETMAALRRDGVVLGDDTSETVAGRLDLIRAVDIDEAQFGDLTALAQQLKDTAVSHLEAGIVRLKQAEEERAELARLRAAEEERQAREAEQREAAERAQAMADYIKQVGLGVIGGQTYAFPILLHELEAKIVIDSSYGDRQAELEALRVETLAKVNEAFERQMAKAQEQAEREAAEKAQQEAARKHTEALAAKERAHQEALAAEKRRADEAEAARKAEADRIASEKAAQEATAKREAAERAAREADVAYKGQIMGEAKQALIDLGLTEAKAKAVVLAIKAGEVPHVSIAF